MLEQRLENQVAIITGASKGIGKGIAKFFAQHGAKLVITSRNIDEIKQVANEIKGDIIPMRADVKNSEHMKSVAETCIKAYGRIDILCHNAGIYPICLIKDMTEQQWDEVCDTNLKGTFLSFKACVAQMEKQAFGKVVVISSITGPKVTQPGFAHYAASKAGVNGFIKTAALEYARHGITVNGIEPGNIATEGLNDIPSEEIKAIKKAIPMGHLGEVEDIAHAALFLSTKESKFITGETIVVDGGQLLPESSYLLER